jgi:hypothetical protein
MSRASAEFERHPYAGSTAGTSVYCLSLRLPDGSPHPRGTLSDLERAALPTRAEYDRGWAEFDAAAPRMSRWFWPIWAAFLAACVLIYAVGWMKPGGLVGAVMLGVLAVFKTVGLAWWIWEQRSRARNHPITRCPHCGTFLSGEGHVSDLTGVCGYCSGRVWIDVPREAASTPVQ